MTFKTGIRHASRKSFFAKTLTYGGFVRHRTAMIIATMKGYFSLEECLRLVLPARISYSRSELQPRYYDYLRMKASEEGARYFSKIHPEIYASGFRGFSDYETMELVDQIIDVDQYHTTEFLTDSEAVVIDAGANIGMFSVLAATKAPNGRIFAFEPAKKTFDMLRHNAERYPNIVCINSGLGDEDSQKELAIKRESAGNIMRDSSAFRLGTDPGRFEKVSVRTLDSFVKERGLGRVDFIKIDTEGYEAKVLRGAAKAIKDYKPVIAMSAYHNKEDKDILPKILKDICPEYICELHKRGEEDLICHVPKER